MSDCPFHSQIAAYHDGELDSVMAGRIEGHLPGCDACRAELAELEEISGLFAPMVQSQTLLPLELARLHGNLSRSLDDRSGTDRPEADFLRTAGLLSSLAASILIISGVWLSEFPSRHVLVLSPGARALPASDLAGVPDWERTALTLRVDPLPNMQTPAGVGDEIPFQQIGVADARSFGDTNADAQIADWMVSGLNGSGLGATGAGHANP